MRARQLGNEVAALRAELERSHAVPHTADRQVQCDDKRADCADQGAGRVDGGADEHLLIKRVLVDARERLASTRDQSERLARELARVRQLELARQLREAPDEVQEGVVRLAIAAPSRSGAGL
jgi:hypothetical protein